MKITRWFKGNDAHGGFVNASTEGGLGMSDCLGSAIGWPNVTGMAQVAQIIDRLFPGRICDCWSSAIQVMHFNNHPETTREDIDKVLLAYTEETEAER